jgi:exodeoxyribonuclease III
MSKSLKIISWNVNGVRAAYKKGLLDWLQSEKPDFLCLQETKAQPDQLPAKLREPKGYVSYWHSAERKGYSGVAVLARKEPINVEMGMGVERFDTEGRVIRVDFDDYVLFNVYFPNGKKNKERLQYKLDFYEEFLDRIESLRREKKKIIFCGDVNTAHNEIDLARPKENEKVSGFLRIERDWLDKVVSLGYMDTFRSLNGDVVQYSWWDLKSRARERNVGWRIDYFIAAPEAIKSVTKAFILDDVMGSDHCPIGIELKANT